MSSDFKSQCGAVLAFVLVMLLLLTLVGTRAIQQNKQQLNLANNARLQAQEFANAESKLAQAKNVIGAYPAHNNYYDDTYFDTSSKLVITNPKHQCTPLRTNTPYRQDIMPAGIIKDTQGNTPLQNAYIIESKCMSLDGYIRLCSTYDETTGKTKVYPRSDPTGKEINCANSPCTADEIATSGFVTCPTIDATTHKLFCGPNNVDCTAMTDDQIAVLCSNTTRSNNVSDLTNDVCYQRYDPQCQDTTWEGTNVSGCSIKPHECPVAVYRR